MQAHPAGCSSTYPALPFSGHGKALRRLHDGFGSKRHPLHWRNLQPSEAGMGASRRRRKGFLAGARLQGPGLVRASPQRGIRDNPRKAAQKMESYLETVPDRTDESTVERPEPGI